MRIRKIISYIIYVMAFSTFLPLSVLLIDHLTRFIGYPTSITEDFYPGRALYQATLMVMPYVICQIIAAALTVRALSLKKLFYLSCVFAILGQLISYIAIKKMLKAISLSFLGMQVGHLLPYIAPVLILALINRKRFVKEPVADVRKGVISGADGIDVTAKHKTGRKIIGLCKRYWYVPDIILIVLVLLYGTLWDPFGLISYKCALNNKMVTLFAMTFILVFLLVPASLCLLALLLRMFISWPRHIQNKHRLLLLRILVIVCLGGYLTLPFTPIKPPGYKTYSKGFIKYVESNADIEAIRDWLGTLKPEDCLEYHIVSTSDVRRQEGGPKELVKKAWPKIITPLDPGHVTLLLDENNQPIVRLTWGGAFGHWGFVVGDEKMPTPGSDLSRYGEYRQEIRKGVYIWYEIQ